jgi:ABC-2 type transport system ATP-binding protein
MTTLTRQPSIIVRDVQKTFLLRHTHSFKETFIAWIKKKTISASFNALSSVSFTVNEGESVAILGYNGSGKSTLLKLISGVLEPDKGKILTRGRVAGLIEVGAGFHPDLSGRENIYLNAAILGMNKKEIDERFDAIVEFSGIQEFIDVEVKHYSSGMFLRLAFSVAIHVKLDILLVDEILAVGDAPFREKCSKKIKELIEEGKTMVVVSHSTNTVRELCERGIVIRKGSVIFDGPIEEAIEAMEKQ